MCRKGENTSIIMPSISFKYFITIFRISIKHSFLFLFQIKNISKKTHSESTVSVFFFLLFLSALQSAQRTFHSSGGQKSLCSCEPVNDNCVAYRHASVCDFCCGFCAAQMLSMFLFSSFVLGNNNIRIQDCVFFICFIGAQQCYLQINRNIICAAKDSVITDNTDSVLNTSNVTHM